MMHVNPNIKFVENVFVITKASFLWVPLNAVTM